MVPVMGHHPSLVTARYTSLYNIDSMFIKKMSVHDRLLNRHDSKEKPKKLKGGLGVLPQRGFKGQRP